MRLVVRIELLVETGGEDSAGLVEAAGEDRAVG